MGVGLMLSGTYGNADNLPPEECLEQIASWLEGHEEEPLMLCHIGIDQDDLPALFLQIHPCAEDIEIAIPAPGEMLVAAKTSTAGPGYHIHVCDLLNRLGEQFGIEWAPNEDEDEDENEIGDDTGYLLHGNAEKVRDEMLSWLGTLSRVIVDSINNDEAQIHMVSMPLNYGYPGNDAILTPLGPRTAEWFRAVIDDPEKGVAFFPWWDEGVGASFFLGRALTRMWQEVRWRTPITEDEGELLMDVHLDLERAHHLDPQADFPWREWREILEYLNDYFGYAEFQREPELESEIQRQAERMPADQALIGYRRGAVEAMLTGGWRLTIPGEMAETWESNGETWSAWHGGRTIWFTSWSFCGETEERVKAHAILQTREWPEGGEHFDYADGPLVGRASLVPYEEDGQALWNLHGYVAVDGKLAQCNIYVQSECDIAWAMDVWKSLKN